MASKQPKLDFFWHPNEHNDDTEDVEPVEGNLEGAARKKVTRSFRPEWCRTFPWLKYDDRGNRMTCEICIQASRSNPFTDGCSNFQNSTLTRHQASKDHTEGVKTLEMQQHFRTSTQNIVQHNREQASAKTEGHIKQLRTVYVMAKNNCPAELFTELMEMQVLNEIKNCEQYYKKHQTVAEMEDSIFEVLETELCNEVKNSPFYGVMVDETCDINIEKKLAIYIRFVNLESGTVKVCFAGNEHINDCTAAGIELALINFLHRKGILAQDNSDIDKFLGLGTSVMTGRINGLGARLKHKVPPLLQVHCAAHRLNLAVSQAGKGIPYLVQFHSYIGSLYRYFKDSSVKYDKLRELQMLLHGHKKQVKEPTSVRWLSVESAINMILEYYDAVIMCLDSATASKDPKAVGLYDYMATSQFLLTTALLADVLCVIGRLSLTFQNDSVNLTDIRTSVETTKATLNSMRQGSTQVNSVIGILGDVDEQIKISKYKEVDIKDNGQFRNRFNDLRNKYISTLLTKIYERFPQDDLDILECLDKLFNPRRYPEKANEIYSYGEPQLNVLTEHFSDYVVKERANSHFLMFKHHIHSVKGAFSFTEICRSLIRDKKEIYPDYAILAEIASVIPVSSAPCERGFSVQNCIKTESRNRLSSVRLNKLMFIKLQGQAVAEFDFNKAVKIFQNKKERRK